MNPILRNTALVCMVYAFAASTDTLSQPVGFFTDVKPVPGVNGPFIDANPATSRDGMTFYFVSNRLHPDVEGVFRFYQATRESPDASFAEISDLGPGVNSDFYNAGIRVSEDGLTLFFNSTRPVDNFGSESFGDHDLYMAKRLNTDDFFGNVTNLGAGVNTMSNDRGPDISADGLTLLFYSNRPGGSGGYDLYMANRENTEEPFGEARSLGDGVNSHGDDWVPSVSADRLTLFFFSSRSGGGLDNQLWVATRANIEAPFGFPVDLNSFSFGSLVNGPGVIEHSPFISPDWPANGSKLYFGRRPHPPDADWGLYEATWVSFADCVIQEGTKAPDCDENGLADDCEVAFGAGHLDTDSDQDGTLDVCEVLEFRSEEVAPWTALDIGEPETPGGARFEGDCLRLLAGRGLLPNRNSDSFRFVQQRMAGDFQFTARLSEWIEAGLNSVAGLMIRESREANSRHAGVVLQRVSGDFRHQSVRRERVFTRLQARDGYEHFDVWLRLERRGDVISGQLSVDGKNWSEPDVVELVDLPEEVHVGMALVSGGDDPTVATFCDLSLLPLAAEFLRGDCNDNGEVDISDGRCILDWRFSGAPAPGCLAATNTNGDGSTNIADAIYLLSSLFLGGPAPVPPFPECGVGTEADAALGCDTAPESCQ